MATDKKNQAIYCSDEEKAIAKAAIAEYRAEQLKRKVELETVPKGPVAPDVFLRLVREYTTPPVALTKPVEYSKQLIITTEQLADFYECEPRRISENFNRNFEHFVEGKHYFKLEDEELKQFKNDYANCVSVGKNANVLYLWTKRGAARHAKMLGTNKAWDVYELLEDAYFTPKQIAESNTPEIRTEPKQLTVQDLSTEELVAEYNRRRNLAIKEAALFEQPNKSKLIITDSDPNIKLNRTSVSIKDLAKELSDILDCRYSPTKLYDFCIANKIPWAPMPSLGHKGRRRREEYRVRRDAVLQHFV